MIGNIEYYLLSGKPIQVTDKLYFHQHSMREIEEEVGYNIYNAVIHSATLEPYVYKYQLELAGQDYKKYTYIRMFFETCMSDETVKDIKGNDIKQAQLTLNVLNLMFDADFILEKFEFDEPKSSQIDYFGFVDIKTGGYLNADNWHLFKNVLEKVFFITQPKERFAKNNLAKKMIIKDMEMTAKENSGSTIYSIISGILWSENCNETHKSIFELTPHQILDGYKYIDKHKIFNAQLSGIYHGTIDATKFKINKNHWSLAND